MGETSGEEQELTTPPRLTLADLRALTPGDLRDLAELRREHAVLEREFARQSQDQAQLEDENGFLRAQLALALAGWREEQQRARNFLPAPPEAAETFEAATPSGPWSRLWIWLAD